MKKIKFALVDNDYVVRAETNLALNDEGDKFNSFLKDVNEELVTGNTAVLEIEGSKFEISRAE